MKLLPVHGNRREYERGIVLEAIREDSLDDAFALLRENLDPPVDIYESSRRYYTLVWACGNYVDYYFGRMIREAKRAGYNSRHACVNLVTQLPQ